jgi:hypothetical protein
MKYIIRRFWLGVYKHRWAFNRLLADLDGLCVINVNSNLQKVQIREDELITIIYNKTI